MRLRPGDQFFALDSGGFGAPAPVAMQGDRLLVIDQTQPRRAYPPPRMPLPAPRRPAYAPAPVPAPLGAPRPPSSAYGPTTGAVGPAGVNLPGWAWVGLGVLAAVGLLALTTGAQDAPRGRGATRGRRGRQG